MSDKTFDALLEDRRQAYIRMEQLEQLCRDIFQAWHNTTDKYPPSDDWNIYPRMQALGLLEGE